MPDVPLYEYQCAEHGRFEVIQKFSDEPLLTCPRCGSEVHKLPSAPAIQFKGTGWYITDYARKSSGGEASGAKDGEKGSKSPGDSSGSKDTKDTKATTTTGTSSDSASGGGTKN